MMIAACLPSPLGFTRYAEIDALPDGYCTIWRSADCGRAAALGAAAKAFAVNDSDVATSIPPTSASLPANFARATMDRARSFKDFISDLLNSKLSAATL